MAVISELQRQKKGRRWRPNRWDQQFDLARDITAPDVGTWLATDGTYPFTVTVSGDFQGVAHLLGCNQEDRPADTETDHPQLGPDITEKQAVEIRAAYCWVKLWVETVDSGAIRRASFYGVENDGS